MKKTLLALIITFTAVVSMAQPWDYDFGTGTGSWTSGSSTDFLPYPSSGTARVSVGSSGGGSFNLENPGLSSLGSETELRIVAPSSVYINKYSIYDYTAGKTFFTKFDILLGDSSGGNTANYGSFYFFQGDGTTYSNNSQFYDTQSFTGIQWSFGSSGAITTRYLDNEGDWTSLGSTPFSQGNVYTVEIYGNNTTSEATYVRAGTPQTLAANKQDIWVGGVLIGDELAKDQLPDDTNIDSFMFYGTSSTGNAANCFLDNITYSNTLPVEPPTTQASNINFPSISPNGMTVGWTNGNGSKRIVIMDENDSFTDPSDGTDPTADNSWNNNGQQVVYNGSGSSVTITGLSSLTTYHYRVYEYNGSGTSTLYLTTTATNNPNSQTTLAPTITTGAVTTPPFYVDSSTSAAGSIAYTSTGTYTSAIFTAKLSDSSGDFTSPTEIGSATVTGIDPTGSINFTIPSGTAEGTGYKIRIDCASPTVTGTESAAFTIQNGAKNVTDVYSAINSGTLTVFWTNPVTIYDEIMIVAKAATSISGTPAGDGSTYSADLNYGSGTSFDGGYVVYKGSSSPQTITGLTDGTIYYVKLFTRKNSNWSTGVEINNTPAPLPSITDIIVPQYMQGLNGINNNRIHTALRLKIDNLTPNATYRYACQFVLAASEPLYNGAGYPIYIKSDGTFKRVTSPDLSTAGSYGEFTADATGNYEGWFMGEPTDNETVFSVGNEIYLRIRLNDGNEGTSVSTRLTTNSPIKVIDFGTEPNINQGTFLYGQSQSPAKNFAFVYDNEAGTGRPIAGNVIESDELDLSEVSQILEVYRSSVDNVSGSWGVIIPNSVGEKGFTGIKRIESRNFSDGSIYAVNTDADGVWNDISTVDPTGGSTTPINLNDEAPLPVELSAFNVSLTPQNTIRVMWVTQSETNVNGFLVYRGLSSDLQQAIAVSPLISATNTSQQQVYLYTDSELQENGTYYYWLQVLDLDGTMNFYGPTSIYYSNGGNSGTPHIPLLTELKTIYPNPFNPSATIQYSLANEAKVKLTIYNVRGQIMRSFNEGDKASGTYKVIWNGTDNLGRACSTGLYYIRMQAGSESFMQKAVLMKQ